MLAVCDQQIGPSQSNENANAPAVGCSFGVPSICTRYRAEAKPSVSSDKKIAQDGGDNPSKDRGNNNEVENDSHLNDKRSAGQATALSKAGSGILPLIARRKCFNSNMDYFFTAKSQ